MDAKTFNESNQIVVNGLSLLTDLCRNSSEAKAFLFTEDGWYHLDRIYRRHPLKVILLLHNVFQDNQILLHMDSSIFKRIFGLYKTFLSGLMKNDQELSAMTTSDAVVLFSWNNLFAQLLKISIEKTKLPDILHMFFDVQELFDEKMVDFIFKNLINTQVLQKNYDNDGEYNLRFAFQMISHTQEQLTDMYENNEYFLGAQQSMMVSEIAYSFLRLLNKATRHVYHGDILKICRKSFSLLIPMFNSADVNRETKNLIQHELLFKYAEGLSIRSEIMRFYRNFYVFNLNSLITHNNFDNDLDDKNYDCNVLVSRAHLTIELEEEGNDLIVDGIPKYIINEIKASRNVSDMIKYWWDEE